jgi:DNA-binding response OmpR family regulator
MKKRVLIIDDNTKVRQTLEDRIVSLGYDFDSAGCQTTATGFLQKRRYDLILLDQELPIKKGKPTHKQVGRNLIDQIRQDANNESTPIIIVTAHDGDNSSVVSDLLLNGATYFIHKPQLAILEEKIKAVFDKQAQQSKNIRAVTASKKEKAKPFTSGRLAFKDDGIFLDEIRLASTATNIGRILRELGKKTDTGKRRAYSCKELASILKLDRGDKAVAEAISPFRKTVIELLQNAGFTADSDTVIARGRSGYELAAGIEAEAETVSADSQTPCETTPEERQQWFIAQAESGKKPSKALYRKEFGNSESTWKRDLRVITLKLEPIGTGSATYYRVKRSGAKA